MLLGLMLNVNNFDGFGSEVWENFGWLWVVVDGKFWLVVGGFGWFLVVLAGCGSLWVVLAHSSF